MVLLEITILALLGVLSYGYFDLRKKLRILKRRTEIQKWIYNYKFRNIDETKLHTTGTNEKEMDEVFKVIRKRYQNSTATEIIDLMRPEYTEDAFSAWVNKQSVVDHRYAKIKDL